MTIFMFYPAKKLGNYFYDDFLIKLYLFKANEVRGISSPWRFII